MDRIIRLSGTVVHGKGAGHLHGMPTANLSVSGVLPEAGVYGGYAVTDGRRFPCVTNIGTRPSDDSDPAPTVETLLLDYTGDLYGTQLTLELHFFLRPIRRFEGGLDAVAAQVRLDSEETRRRLAAERAPIRCSAGVRLTAGGESGTAGFGKGLAVLLEGVETYGSINRATQSMGMAYSKAWRLLNRAEEEFGVTLLDRSGAHGSSLTAEAHRLITLYREALAAAQRAAEEKLAELTGEE